MKKQRENARQKRLISPVYFDFISKQQRVNIAPRGAYYEATSTQAQLCVSVRDKNNVVLRDDG